MADTRKINSNLYQITNKNGKDCVINTDNLNMITPDITRDGSYNIFQKGLAGEPVNVTEETYREFIKDMHNKEDEKLQK